MTSRPEGINEFLHECYAIYTLYSLSISGLMHEANKFRGIRPTKQNPRPKLLIGDKHPSQGEFVSYIFLDELTEKSKKDGVFEDSLSKQSLFYMFTIWEEKYRNKIASEVGAKKNEVMCDLMGEVRLLRNKITHANSILTLSVLDNLPILRDNFEVGFFTLNRNFMSNFMKKLQSAEIYLQKTES